MISAPGPRHDHRSPPTPPARCPPTRRRRRSPAVLAAVIATATTLVVVAGPAGSVAVGGPDDEATTTALPVEGDVGTLALVEGEITEATEVYRTVDGRQLTVEVDRPADADGTRPAVVLIHGGGWYSGEPADMDPWADLATDAGWVAFSLEYRLATQGGGGPAWPQSFQDVQAGVEWVHRNAPRYGADPGKLAVFGESAGAHLTVLLAVEGTGGDAEIRAATAWSAPLDLASLAPAGGTVPGCEDNPQCEEFWSLGVVEWFVGCAPSSCASAYAAASPVGQAGKGTAPLWFANSTEELVPLPPAQQLDRELTAAGVDHRLVTLPGMAHAHGYGPAVWNDMVPWLADRLGVSHPDPAPFPGPSGDRSHLLAVAVGAGVLVLLAAGAAATVRERRGAHQP